MKETKYITDPERSSDTKEGLGIRRTNCQTMVGLQEDDDNAVSAGTQKVQVEQGQDQECLYHAGHEDIGSPRSTKHDDAVKNPYSNDLEYQQPIKAEETSTDEGLNITALGGTAYMKNTEPAEDMTEPEAVTDKLAEMKIVQEEADKPEGTHAEDADVVENLTGNFADLNLAPAASLQNGVHNGFPGERALVSRGPPGYVTYCVPDDHMARHCGRGKRSTPPSMYEHHTKGFRDQDVPYQNFGTHFNMQQQTYAPVNCQTVNNVQGTSTGIGGYYTITPNQLPNHGDFVGQYNPPQPTQFVYNGIYQPQMVTSHREPVESVDPNICRSPDRDSAFDSSPATPQSVTSPESKADETETFNYNNGCEGKPHYDKNVNEELKNFDEFLHKYPNGLDQNQSQRTMSDQDLEVTIADGLEILKNEACSPPRTGTTPDSTTSPPHLAATPPLSDSATTHVYPTNEYHIGYPQPTFVPSVFGAQQCEPDSTRRDSAMSPDGSNGAVITPTISTALPSNFQFGTQSPTETPRQKAVTNRRSSKEGRGRGKGRGNSSNRNQNPCQNVLKQRPEIPPVQQPSGPVVGLIILPVPYGNQNATPRPRQILPRPPEPPTDKQPLKSATSRPPVSTENMEQRPAALLHEKSSVRSLKDKYMESEQFRQMVMRHKSTLAKHPVEDLMKEDDDGDTQLHIAIAQEATMDIEAACLAIINRLENEGKLKEALETRNNRKQTPMYMAAAIERNTTLIKTFNEYKAEPNVMVCSERTNNREWNAAIHVLAGGGQKAIHALKELLKNPLIEVDKKNSNGMTALHCAIVNHGKENRYINDKEEHCSEERDSTETIRLLIQNNASLYTQTDTSFDTAFHLIVKNGFVDLLEKVLQMIRSPQELDKLLLEAVNGSNISVLHMAFGQTSLSPAEYIRMILALIKHRTSSNEMHSELKKLKNKAKSYIPDMRKAILDEKIQELAKQKPPTVTVSQNQPVVSVVVPTQIVTTPSFSRTAAVIGTGIAPVSVAPSPCQRMMMIPVTGTATTSAAAAQYNVTQCNTLSSQYAGLTVGGHTLMTSQPVMNYGARLQPHTAPVLPVASPPHNHHAVAQNTIMENQCVFNMSPSTATMPNCSAAMNGPISNPPSALSQHAVSLNGLQPQFVPPFATPGTCTSTDQYSLMQETIYTSQNTTAPSDLQFLAQNNDSFLARGGYGNGQSMGTISPSWTSSVPKCEPGDASTLLSQLLGTKIHNPATCTGGVMTSYDSTLEDKKPIVSPTPVVVLPEQPRVVLPGELQRRISFLQENCDSPVQPEFQSSDLQVQQPQLAPIQSNTIDSFSLEDNPLNSNTEIDLDEITEFLDADIFRTNNQAF